MNDSKLVEFPELSVTKTMTSNRDRNNSLRVAVPETTPPTNYHSAAARMKEITLLGLFLVSLVKESHAHASEPKVRTTFLGRELTR